MEVVNEILKEALEATEYDTPEWERVSNALDEVSGFQRHLEAVKKQQEVTSDALYRLQFVTHEKLIQRYMALKKFVKESGLEIPEGLR